MPTEFKPFTNGRFIAVPIQMPGSASTGLHYLYARPTARQGSASNADKYLASTPEHPKGRTLFVTNLPTDSQEEHIRRIFSEWGELERVYLEDGSIDDLALAQAHPALLEMDWGTPLISALHKETDLSRLNQFWVTDRAPTPKLQSLLASGASAQIVFARAEDLAAFVRSAAEETDSPSQPREWLPASTKSDGVAHRGLSRYLAQFRAARAEPEILQAQAEKYLARQQQTEAARRRVQKHLAVTEDDDGFQLVGKRLRSTYVGKSLINVNSVDYRSAQKLQTRDHNVVDFYRFQQREAKKNELADLRAKFEADKQRINDFKNIRNFRPF
ncbi:hypothetical protein H4R33_000002 [Dimargaris cristalligena]|uniref:Ribosomal RNA-processing protein 7-domain-containing protein n=1 Tax=Dimargaris cristalligena TaxID=215637 RepID=A0A4V1J535_9FUNG|nr:hypothetical protein H4R33_000002 [Dimargaris cristalligena]RKP37679.1 ribosomal RNA-processing protein 7-domain-containing protein [Dimargaris cristalligena]|eukprot:RKP37679.1 ribosomal RNA-processing protein 7-domain-containing protein [Dimargaris cristalligena]